MEDDDITRMVISPINIRKKFSVLFPDSVMIDNKFNIVSVSENILVALGRTIEVIGKSIGELGSGDQFQKFLRENLYRGHIEPTNFLLESASGRLIEFEVSGFYLGLISDISDLIMLRMRNTDEVCQAKAKLQLKEIELDNFVYMSSHALRGPLATIKGLVNLAKISDDGDERVFLINQISQFTDKLDEKLHHLIFYAEADKGYELSDAPLLLDDMSERLRQEVNEGIFDFPVRLDCHVKQRMEIPQGQMVFSLLHHLIQFFANHSKTDCNLLTVDALQNPETTEIFLRAKGFLIPGELAARIETVNDGYSEILKHPEWLTLYAAKKIVTRLKGKMQLFANPSHEYVVVIALPNCPT